MSRQNDTLPRWGDPPRPRWDWGLIWFILGYGAVWAVLLHIAMGRGL